MKESLKTIFILLSVAGFFLATSCKKNEAIPEGNIEFSMLDAVNKLRSTGCMCGEENMPPVPALIWNTALANAAGAHAMDMSQRNYFEHISPEGNSPIQRVAAAGYKGSTVLENIGRGYKNTADVMAAWKLSESHCKAMMSPESVEMGAYSFNGFWVQEFGH